MDNMSEAAWYKGQNIDFRIILNSSFSINGLCDIGQIIYKLTLSLSMKGYHRSISL